MSYHFRTKQVNKTMKTHHSIIYTLLTLMIGGLLLATTACKKSPETIGNGLITDDNVIGLFHTDTMQVFGHSYLDSIGSKNVSYGLLGSMNDPVFGLTQAGFSTQLHLSTTGHSFGNNPVFDSLILQLSIADYYGDTNSLITVHAYELTDSISIEEEYYSYSQIPINEALDHANGFQFRPHPKTNTVIIDSDTVHHAIVRIPLSSMLGNFLINLDSTVYKEPDAFKRAFPGLCLKCEPANGIGNICYIQMTDNTNTQLRLYYHEASVPEKSLRYNFYITSSDNYFNQFNHNYTMGDAGFVSQVLENDTTLGQQTLYLQSMGGVRTKLFFPHLTHWADTLIDSHIVINQAKLILPIAVTDSSLYSVPNTLVLVGFNEDNTTYLLPDYYEGTSYFGGSYNASTHSVSFRISEYLQDILTGTRPNYGLSLGINGAAYNAKRLILNGPDVEEDKLKVEITYSIVKE